MTEGELEEVLAIAPFIDRDILTEEYCKLFHLVTPKRGRGVSRPPSTRRKQRSPTVTPVADPEKVIKDAKGKQRLLEATSQSVKKVPKKYVPKQRVPFSTLESKYSAEKSQVETASLENKVDVVNLGSTKFFSHSSPSKFEISTIPVKEEKTKFLSIN